MPDLSSPSSDFRVSISSDGTAAILEQVEYEVIPPNTLVLRDSHIFVSRRPCGECFFGQPALSCGVNSGRSDGQPWLSGDGLRLYFMSNRNGPMQLFVAKRPDSVSCFEAPMLLGDFSLVGYDLGGPSLTQDELTIYFSAGIQGASGTSDIWRAERPHRDSAFGPATSVSEVNSNAQDDAPWITPNGLVLYFSSRRPGGHGDADIWVATRPNAVADFSEPINLDAVNTSGYECWPSLSPDELGFYFSRSDSGALADVRRMRAGIDIAWPSQGAAVRGVTLVTGSIDCGQPASYRLVARRVGGASWDTLTQAGVAAAGRPFAAWDTRGYADGDYDLRLEAFSGPVAPTRGVRTWTVEVDNEEPFAWQRPPVRIPFQTGGDVYTRDDRLHLYFPPHAFEEEFEHVIRVDTSWSAPATMSALGHSYEVYWDGAPLAKPAVLKWSCTLPLASGQTPVLYFKDAHGFGEWSSIGGTADPSRGCISAPIDSEGTYALVEGQPPPERPGQAIAEFTLTPRILSRRGGLGNRSIGIGFALGQAEAVSVKIYNPAGRLVREVVSSTVLGAGRNLVSWDGLDEDGRLAEDGIYLVAVEARGHTLTKPLAVVR